MKFLSLFLFVFIVSCAHKVEMGDNQAFNEKNGLSSRIVWVKNKGETIDMMVRIESFYKNPILIQGRSMRMEFEGAKDVGYIRPNERYILEYEDAREFLVIFKFSPPAAKSGSGKIIFKKIYEFKDDKKGKELPDLVQAFTLNPKKAPKMNKR